MPQHDSFPMAWWTGHGFFISLRSNTAIEMVVRIPAVLGKSCKELVSALAKVRGYRGPSSSLSLPLNGFSYRSFTLKSTGRLKWKRCFLSKNGRLKWVVDLSREQDYFWNRWKCWLNTCFLAFFAAFGRLFCLFGRLMWVVDLFKEGGGRLKGRLQLIPQAPRRNL